MKIYIIICIMSKFSSLSDNIVRNVKGLDPATPLVSITSIIPTIGKSIGILINFNQSVMGVIIIIGVMS